MQTLDLLIMQREELDKNIEEIAESKEYIEKVKILRGYRGIGTLTAMILISEIIDFTRFKTAKEIMSYIGLVPREFSSGGKEVKGSITKTGNSRIRRALIESSWHYIKKTDITKRMKNDLKELSGENQKIPVKALNRLHKKFYRLTLRGKERQKAIVAVARELVGFIWFSMVHENTNIKMIKKPEIYVLKKPSYQTAF